MNSYPLLVVACVIIVGYVFLKAADSNIPRDKKIVLYIITVAIPVIGLIVFFILKRFYKKRRRTFFYN
jgi:membrane protein DedA with SNARE-associated domain